MGVDYDAWLEEPYQDECEAADAYDEAEESFRESDYYAEGFSDWLQTNQGKSEEDWELTSDYVNRVESFQAMRNEPQTEGDSK